ncbi:hypothetical protein D9M73_275940 [compost metagenome]
MSLPVKPLASLMALIVASVPELTIRIFSMEGMRVAINVASLFSCKVGNPKLVPLMMASRSASETSLSACP